MHSPIRRLICLITALGCALAGTTVARAQAGHAHVHGEVALEIGIEASSINLQLAAPQDSLLGHERRPGTPAEQQAAAALMQRLQAGAALFGLPASLGCKLASAEIDAPQLQPASMPNNAAAPKATTPPKAANDSHAEIVASYRFDCARVAGLRSLDLGALMDAFPRIQRLSAQVAGPGGQAQAQLRRPARVLAWGR